MVNKYIISVIGMILTITGGFATISFSIQDKLYGIIISGILIVTGLILLAWSFGD